MRPRRLAIGRIFRCNSLGAATFEKIFKLLNSTDRNLGQSHNVNVAFGVFSKNKLISFVEKVKEFGTVNFVERQIRS